LVFGSQHLLRLTAGFQKKRLVAALHVAIETEKDSMQRCTLQHSRAALHVNYTFLPLTILVNESQQELL